MIDTDAPGPRRCVPSVTTRSPAANPESPADSAVSSYAAKPKRVVEDGMYKLGDDIYKVQVAVHGSGNLYAKKLVITAPPSYDGDGKVATPAKVEFDYERGAISKLRAENKMTLDEAKAFGALYGTCCRCGATLTREESIEAGIGPICAGKFS